MEIKSPPLWLAWMERTVAIAAGLAAIWGVFVWLSEAPDRKEERDQRRSDQIARANEILSSAAGPANDIDSDRNPNIQWAINKLAQYGQRAVLDADNVQLSNINIDCATLLIRARTASITDVTFRASQIAFTGETLDVDYTNARGLLIFAFADKKPVEVKLDHDTMQDSRISGAQPATLGRQQVTFETYDSEFKNLGVNYEWKFYHLPGLSSFPMEVAGSGVESVEQAVRRCIPGQGSDPKKNQVECQVLGRIDDPTFNLGLPKCHPPIFGSGIDAYSFPKKPDAAAGTPAKADAPPTPSPH